jgi:hypothetical protein
MSFSIQKTKNNYPLVKIKGGKYNNEIIYLDNDIPDKEDKTFDKTFNKIAIKDGLFQLVPNTKKERECIVIIGKSGSGKSHFILNYCLEYKKTYPKRDIFLISNLREDETLDKLKDLSRIRVDDELVNNPINPEEELRDCCVIFDDIDGMSKHISKAVKTLLEILITQGRHWNTTVIYAGHTIDGKSSDGKKLLAETHYFVYFPWGATRSINYILNSYLDIDKDTLRKIKSTHSRWCCVGCNFPQPIITEKNLMMMAHNDV